MKFSVESFSAPVQPDVSVACDDMLASVEQWLSCEDVGLEHLEMFQDDPDVVAMEHLSSILTTLRDIDTKASTEGYTPELHAQLLGIDGIEIFVASTEGIMNDLNYAWERRKEHVKDVIRKVTKALLVVMFRVVNKISSFVHGILPTSRAYRTELLRYKKDGMFTAGANKFDTEKFLSSYARVDKYEAVSKFIKKTEFYYTTIMNLIKNPKPEGDAKEFNELMEMYREKPLLPFKLLPGKIGPKGYTVKNTQELAVHSLAAFEKIVAGSDGVTASYSTFSTSIISYVLNFQGSLAIDLAQVVASNTTNANITKPLSNKIDALIDDGKIKEYKEVQERLAHTVAFLTKYTRALAVFQLVTRYYGGHVTRVCRQLDEVYTDSK
jgi:hypothetical protein